MQHQRDTINYSEQQQFYYQTEEGEGAGRMPHRIGDDENIELENYHKANHGEHSSSSSQSEISDDDCLREIEVEAINNMDLNHLVSASSSS